MLYFLLAYLFSWSCWIPLAGAARRASDSTGGLYLLGGLGPVAAALLTAACSGGRPALADLLRRLTRWRVRPVWYLLAGGLIPALVLLAAGAAALAGGGRVVPPRGLETVLVFGFLTAVIAVEEVGWRGFALPRLQLRWGALASSLVLGGLWAGWHLPLFWVEPRRILAGSRLLSFGQLLAGLTGVTVLMTWVYNSTRGSVLLACLMHASMNTSAGEMTPVSAPDGQRLLWSWLVTLAVCLFAVGLVAYYGPADLAARGRSTYPETPGPPALEGQP